MKQTINYIAELNAFNRWLATHYLPPKSQLLWYRIIALFNQSGWEEEIVADNPTLMQQVGDKREATFINQTRKPLLDNHLLVLYKGRKGHPNRYRMLYIAEENKSTNAARDIMDYIESINRKNKIQALKDASLD